MLKIDVSGGGNVIGGRLSRLSGRDFCDWETALSGDCPLEAEVDGSRVGLLKEDDEFDNSFDVSIGDATAYDDSKDELKSKGEWSLKIST